MSEESVRTTGSQHINGHPAYVVHKPGIGTYIEYAKDDDGVFPAPCPLNASFIVEEWPDPENRELWDGMTQDQRRSAAIHAAREAGLIGRRFTLPPETLERHDSGCFQQPGPDDLRTLMRQQGWTGSRVGKLAGVDGRTVRRWTGGDYQIPYAAWRILLIEAGMIKLEFHRSVSSAHREQ